ncbi:MAG TPA: site-2 protease family protein [Patescibacteria group bacterium]|nr:site-2 protease family protein [Patescibacteria group bacterium]
MMLYSLLLSDPLSFLLVAVALVASITIHECAHALVADKLGDPTARIAGRITLNPLAHLDPLGTLAMLFVGFGWGKPVMFDPYNLKDPKRDSMLIAAAGPISNLLLALLLSLVLHFLSISLTSNLYALISLVVATNVGLAIFNLIPIHPLDGGKILIGLAPDSVAREWNSILSRYGTLILLFLILPINGQSAVSSLLSPVVNAILKVLL